jgi:hypothetical protein
MSGGQEIHRLGERPSTLPPRLEGLLAYWLQKCGGRAMPSRDELPVAELRPWLGQLALIEVGGERRIRLCGTNLIRRFGREATGLSVDELAPDIAQQLRAILTAANKAMTPIIALSQVRLGRATITHAEVALPLAGADGRLASVLLGSCQVKAS